MILVESFMPPLSEFPVLPHLITLLRSIIAAEIPEELRDDLDVWLPPQLREHEHDEHGRVRLTFMADEKILCKIPVRVLLHAESTSVSRCN